MNAVPPEISAALPQAPALAAAFSRLARGDPSDLLGNLVEVETDFEIEDTLARTHCYAIGTDGNDLLRTNLLAEAVCETVVEYAIPRSQIREAYELCAKKNHSTAIVKLANEARALFTHLSQTGEGGELLLFCLAEFILGYPQIMAKMQLKTSSDMHYHGADGIHASVDGASGKLCLWWGESKLHQTAGGAIRECLKSIAPFLIEPASIEARRARDLNLLRSYVDLDDLKLEGAIRCYLDTKSPNFGRLKFGGLCLVGFDDKNYPVHPKKADIEAISKALLESSAGWKNKAGERLAENQLIEFDLHIFFVPFPSVEDFRAAVLKGVGAA